MTTVNVLLTGIIALRHMMRRVSIDPSSVEITIKFKTERDLYHFQAECQTESRPMWMDLFTRPKGVDPSEPPDFTHFRLMGIDFKTMTDEKAMRAVRYVLSQWR